MYFLCSCPPFLLFYFVLELNINVSVCKSLSVKYIRLDLTYDTVDFTAVDDFQNEIKWNMIWSVHNSFFIIKDGTEHGFWLCYADPTSQPPQASPRAWVLCSPFVTEEPGAGADPYFLLHFQAAGLPAGYHFPNNKHLCLLPAREVNQHGCLF